jgi:Ca-activated chloride channel family protein
VNVLQKFAKDGKERQQDASSNGTLRSLRTSVALVVVCVVAIVVCIQLGLGLWLTPDQQGRRRFQRGEFNEAAVAFHDPMWQGTAFYRAGEFEKAAQAFTRRDTDEGLYNQGNAWLMRGEYEKAVGCYDRALEKCPDWQDAIDNRELATARAAMVKQTGGDMGDQKLGADKIVFDKKAKNEGQETEIDGTAPVSDKEIQAMWLRRVQTRPADFLKAKFAYQQAMKQGAAE